MTASTASMSASPTATWTVIGRRGRTAASIRTVTRAAASKDGATIDIEFLD